MIEADQKQIQTDGEQIETDSTTKILENAATRDKESILDLVEKLEGVDVTHKFSNFISELLDPKVSESAESDTDKEYKERDASYKLGVLIVDGISDSDGRKFKIFKPQETLEEIPDSYLKPGYKEDNGWVFQQSDKVSDSDKINNSSYVELTKKAFEALSDVIDEGVLKEVKDLFSFSGDNIVDKDLEIAKLLDIVASGKLDRDPIADKKRQQKAVAVFTISAIVHYEWMRRKAMLGKLESRDELQRSDYMTYLKSMSDKYHDGAPELTVPIKQAYSEAIKDAYQVRQANLEIFRESISAA